jgi:hypothetical protein
MGDNECWEAIGPAQALFTQISQPIGELLDTRVEEIEEGEPVAGNILTYGMYMIGRDLSTARPTLIVTCQRPKPRRRAIKFIKESEFLKGHPKIAIAESSAVPMALGRKYLRLLSGHYFLSSTPSSTTWTPKRDTTTAPSTSVTALSSHAISTAALGGIIGAAIGVLAIILITVVFIIRGLNKASKAAQLANSRASSSSHIRSGRGGHKQLSTDLDIDAMSVDPLMMTGTSLSGSMRRPEMNANMAVSPHIFTSPFSSRSPPVTHYPRGYNSVASSSSEYASSQSRSEFSGVSDITSVSSRYKQPTLDKSPPLIQNAGYFDLPYPSSNCLSFISSQAQRPSQNKVSAITTYIPPTLGTSHEHGASLPFIDATIHCNALYGMPILITATGKVATLGGVLFSNSKFFGLTVRHSFLEACKTTSGDTIQNPATSRDDNHEFAFDSDMSDATITSQDR